MLKTDLRRISSLIAGGKMRKLIGVYRTPGAHAVVVFRFGQWLLRQNMALKIALTPFYYIMFQRIRKGWGIEIPRETKIGRGLYIGHFGGIIISPGACIGDNVAISQQVTIGVAGNGDKRGCPSIGDDVYIGPGAKIFGKIRIGNNVKIGANAVIHRDIPDNAIVASDPGFKIISMEGNRRD